jgi:thiol:disulfide interchange protein
MVKIVSFIFVLSLAFVQSTNGSTDSTQDKSIQTISVLHLEDSMKQNPKPVVIYYYADWCKWCKLLEVNVLSDSTIVDSMNAHYYFVKFDGEYQGEIQFLGRTYSYIKTGDKQGYHEFCMVFDKISAYPSLVFLNSHFERKETVAGYLKAKELIQKMVDNLN